MSAMMAEPVLRAYIHFLIFQPYASTGVSKLWPAAVLVEIN